MSELAPALEAAERGADVARDRLAVLAPDFALRVDREPAAERREPAAEREPVPEPAVERDPVPDRELEPDREPDAELEELVLRGVDRPAEPPLD